VGCIILIIGDVHGKVNEYKKIINNCHQSIQVGDFSVDAEDHRWAEENLPPNHWINFGNHDDASFLTSDHSCGDYQLFSQFNLMTIRGAYSIDRQYRYQGINWWDEEEMGYSSQISTLDFYKQIKPRIVVSHDCPSFIADIFFGITDHSSTRRFLRELLTYHKPDMWIFGHHHKSKRQLIDGTLFISLAELEVLEL